MARNIIPIVVLFFLTLPASAGDLELTALSDGIVIESNRLMRASYQKAYADRSTDTDIAESLRKLKILIHAYENKIARPVIIPIPTPLPKPKPVIDLKTIGTTSAAKDGSAVLYTDAKIRKIPYRKIKIEHLSGNYYIRIWDIKIVTASGQTLAFNAGGGKFYLGDSYEVELPTPAPISEISVRVQHRTEGLIITGTPLPPRPPLPTVVELGVTNGVKDGNVTLNTRMLHRTVKIRKLAIKHSGGDEYLRLNNLTVTTANGEVIILELPRGKFHRGDTWEIDLPKPIHIKSVSLRVQHRTNGLIISGIR